MDSMYGLLTRDSFRSTADLAAEMALKNPKYYTELIYLSRFSDSPLNWRALRCVELCDIQNSKLILPYINFLAREFPLYTIDGQNRILPKIFSNHIEDLNDEFLGAVVDKCFTLLLNPKNAIAVLVNAMQFLFDLSQFYHDLKPELFAVVQQIYTEKGNSAAIKIRAKKILRNLETK